MTPKFNTNVQCKLHSPFTLLFLHSQSPPQDLHHAAGAAAPFCSPLGFLFGSYTREFFSSSYSFQTLMSSRWRKVIFPLYCTPIKSPPGVLCAALSSSAREGRGPVGASSKEDTKMLRGLETSWEFGVVQTGQESSRDTFFWPFSTWRALVRNTGTIFWAGTAVIRQGTMVLNWKSGNLEWILERRFLLWGWWGTDTGCPEKLWMPYPWKCCWPGCMGIWETQSS